MKRIILFLCAASLTLGLSAQLRNDSVLQAKMENVKLQLEDFDTEHLIDSLDQEKLPRLVSGGLFGGGNLSNFIITRNHRPMSSYMRIGAELGGFIDFAITKHFTIQPQIILTAHQNYFAATDTTNRLWSFGVEIPIYFLGKFGSLDKGYIQFGGGVFTHFTYLSNVKDKYQNIDKSTDVNPVPSRVIMDMPNYDYSRLYQLHNNHFGVCVLVGYEFKFGMQINATYKISFSDIATFYKEKKGEEVANALIYPQSVSLSIGYHWR